MKEIRIRLTTPEPAYDCRIEKPADAIALMQAVIGDMAHEYFALNSPAGMFFSSLNDAR